MECSQETTIGEDKIMEKEVPRGPKKKQKKESERRAPKESQPSEGELPAQSRGELIGIKVGDLKESIRSPAVRSGQSDASLRTKTQPRFSFQVSQQQGETPSQAITQTVRGPRRRLTPEQIECEADLYACIATLNSLISNFEEGNLDISTYKRQVQSLITDIMSSKIKLEKTGISMEEFLREENIVEQYALACEKFKLLDSNATLQSFVESLAVTKADVASSTAEIVTDFITLSDYAKLGGDMAKVESLIPILEHLLSLLQKFPTTRKDYWGLELLRQWHAKLSTLPFDAVLTPDEAKKLEIDIVRLFDDFRRRLREI